ncbi:hypothetical protein BC830DRAFT_1128500 [Chytriomyces sp. MP71]|nr:hypothetical protein BC830DRAFT_1128500 [Chytriomyces sp. MP71]
MWLAQLPAEILLEICVYFPTNRLHVMSQLNARCRACCGMAVLCGTWRFAIKNLALFARASCATNATHVSAAPILHLGSYYVRALFALFGVRRGSLALLVKQHYHPQLQGQVLFRNDIMPDAFPAEIADLAFEAMSQAVHKHPLHLMHDLEIVFYWASAHGNLNLVEMGMQEVTSNKTKFPNGLYVSRAMTSAFLFACGEEQLVAARKILSSGLVDLRQYGRDALLMAASQGAAEVVKVLLEGDSSWLDGVNAQAIVDTAVIWAARLAHFEVVDVISRSGVLISVATLIELQQMGHPVLITV